MADLGPRRLHELAELDPGRAGSLASSAIEAERHVANERLGRLDAPLAKRPHQVQAAARRFGLDVQLAKGRAVRHAEPAVDTPTEFGFRRRIRDGESSRAQHRQIQVSGAIAEVASGRAVSCVLGSPLGRTLPGLNRPLGSNASRTRAIRSRSESEKIQGMYLRFSSPTPCSPVIVPPASTQARMIWS